MRKKSKTNAIIIEQDWDNPKSNINIETDVSGKMKVNGCFFHNSIKFEFSITEQSSGPYLLRGFVRAKDATGKTIVKYNKRAGTNTKVSTEIYMNDSDPNAIKIKIASAAIKLYSNFTDVLIDSVAKHSNPSTITPSEAAIMHAKSFIATRNDTASASTQEAYVNRIKRCLALFPAKPMSEFSTSAIKKILVHANIANENTIKMLYEFWQHCIDFGICIGNNPIELPRKTPKGVGAAAVKKLTKISTISLPKLHTLYDFIEKNLNGVNVAIALMTSNVDVNLINALTWKDLRFMGPLDYVVIRIYNPKRGGATHNLDRPLLPRVSEIVSAYYDVLRKTYSDEELMDIPVCSLKTDILQPLSPKRIVAEAERTAYKFIITPEELAEVKKLDPTIAAIRTIFNNTYSFCLLSHCNLPQNGLHYKYLMAGSFSGDVTLDHYAALSSDLGMDSLYTRMRPLAKKRNLQKAENTVLGNTSTIISVPDNTLEYSKLHMTCIIQPNAKVEIKCPHGVFGHVKARGIDGEDAPRRK